MANQPDAGPDRRTRILEAAERVFALEGYHGTTLRQIAREAGVKLSLVAYHFETKQALYVAVFTNRQHVNTERARRLRAIPDLGAPDALEQVVDAFMQPVVELGAEARWYRRLVLREAADPSSGERPVVRELFDPMAREFIAAFRQILPDKPAGFHEWCYLFAVGALTQSAFDDRMANLAGGAGPGGVKNDLLRSFIIAGLRHG